jgi:hypothetical protein
VLLCVLAGAALGAAVLNSRKHDDLRKRLAALEQDTAERLQDLHDRDALLTGYRAGDAEAARQEVPPVAKRVTTVAARVEAVGGRVDRLRDALEISEDVLSPPPPPGHAPPRATFHGSGGYTHHVIWLIERTALTGGEGRFDILRSEVQKSLATLRDVQKFHLIFFGGPKLLEGPGEQMVPATPRYRSAGAAFAGAVGPTGQEAALAPALARAIDVLEKADPDKPGRLVYVVTAGPIVDAKEAEELAAHQAADAGILINTYMYCSEDPELRETLMVIAKATGGRFKHVTEEDLATPSE